MARLGQDVQAERRVAAAKAKAEKEAAARRPVTLGDVAKRYLKERKSELRPRSYLLPSEATLALSAGCSVSSVKRAIRALRAQSVLIIEEPGGGRRSNRYRLIPERLAQLGEDVRQSRRSGRTGVSVTPVSVTPGTHDPAAGSQL